MFAPDHNSSLLPPPENRNRRSARSVDVSPALDRPGRDDRYAGALPKDGDPPLHSHRRDRCFHCRAPSRRRPGRLSRPLRHRRPAPVHHCRRARCPGSPPRRRCRRHRRCRHCHHCRRRRLGRPIHPPRRPRFWSRRTTETPLPMQTVMRALLDDDAGAAIAAIAPTAAIAIADAAVGRGGDAGPAVRPGNSYRYYPARPCSIAPPAPPQPPEPPLIAGASVSRVCPDA